jgi:hypothetical protein
MKFEKFLIFSEDFPRSPTLKQTLVLSLIVGYNPPLLRLVDRHYRHTICCVFLDS